MRKKFNFGYANIFKFLVHVAKYNPNIESYKAKSGHGGPSWAHYGVWVLF